MLNFNFRMGEKGSPLRITQAGVQQKTRKASLRFQKVAFYLENSNDTLAAQPSNHVMADQTLRKSFVVKRDKIAVYFVLNLKPQSAPHYPSDDETGNERSDRALQKGAEMEAIIMIAFCALGAR